MMSSNPVTTQYYDTQDILLEFDMSQTVQA